MPRRNYLLVGGSLAALVAVLFVVAWGLTREPRLPSVRMPDGEVLQLRAVTAGTTHQWAAQTWWQRLLGPLVPAKFAAEPYHTNFYTGGPQRPHLVFWFTGPGRQLNGRKDTRSVYVADESGREYARASNLYEWRLKNPRVEYFSVPLPKRGRTVSLHVYDASGQRVDAATVAVPPVPPSPASSRRPAPPAAYLDPPAPGATAPPCPVTSPAGPVSVTLTEVTTGLSSGGGTRSRPEVLLARHPKAAGPGEIPWTRAAVRLEPPNSGWTPLTLTLRDTSGDTVSHGYQQKRQNGITWFGLSGWIGADGGPLSARVMLQRQDDSAYRPDQLWVLPQVAVPKDGTETVLERGRTLQGVKLQVHALAARGTPTGPKRRDLEKSPYIRVRVDTLGPGRLLTVWSVDERGRRSDTELKAYGGHGRPYDYRLRLPIPRDSRRVTLYFAIHSGYETKLVDLAVQPGAPPAGGLHE
jgi:hypothetical protein